jgi:hypothetical protein
MTKLQYIVCLQSITDVHIFSIHKPAWPLPPYRRKQGIELDIICYLRNTKRESNELVDQLKPLARNAVYIIVRRKRTERGLKARGKERKKEREYFDVFVVSH